MAGFRVAPVTLVPVSVELEIQHSQPIGIILKQNTEYFFLVSSFRVNIFTFLHFYGALSQDRTRAKPRQMFT